MKTMSFARIHDKLFFCSIIGASLSEPHIDELNVRNLMFVRLPRAAIHVYLLQAA